MKNHFRRDDFATHHEKKLVSQLSIVDVPV